MCSMHGRSSLKEYICQYVQSVRTEQPVNATTLFQDDARRRGRDTCRLFCHTRAFGRTASEPDFVALGLVSSPRPSATLQVWRRSHSAILSARIARWWRRILRTVIREYEIDSRLVVIDGRVHVARPDAFLLLRVAWKRLDVWLAGRNGV